MRQFRRQCRQAVYLIAVFLGLMFSAACGASEENNGGSGEIALGTSGSYVEGVGERQNIMRSVSHVDLNATTADDIVAYNSVPPTSGDHWSTPVRCGFYIEQVPDELIVHNMAYNSATVTTGTPVRCGFYIEQVPDELIVHNMEHSNIVVSYNLSRADVDSLRDVYNGLPEFWRDHFTVVRPYKKIDEGRVALSAWGVLDNMDGVDRGRIVQFFEHYVGRLGPEGAIPCRGTQDNNSGG